MKFDCRMKSSRATFKMMNQRNQSKNIVHRRRHGEGFLPSAFKQTEIFRSAQNGIGDNRIGSKQAGSSLVELMMVIVFLGVGFLTTLSMMSAGIQKSTTTELLTQGLFLAEQKLEEMRADKGSKGYAYLTPRNYSIEYHAGGHKGFTRQVKITTFKTYKEVTVIVKHSGTPDIKLVTQFTSY